MVANAAAAARAVAMHRATRDRRDGTAKVIPHTLLAAPSGSLVSSLNTIAISTPLPLLVSKRFPAASRAHDVALREANAPIIPKKKRGCQAGRDLPGSGESVMESDHGCAVVPEGRDPRSVVGGPWAPGRGQGRCVSRAKRLVNALVAHQA